MFFAYLCACRQTELPVCQKKYFSGMRKFLEYVAEDIIRKYGTNLSDVAAVFPNKRAALFLNEHLARIAGRPIWSPAYITISDFFRRHSDLTVADQIKLVCDMHKSFTECTGIDETLDHFFGWGQLLLSDFDDIDKNMAEASDVFKNVRDMHELDDISYLDDEQKSVLRRFFSNFTDSDDSELKKRFIRLWCHLEDIYNDFRRRLREQRLAYEGMLYRDVAGSNDINYHHGTYLFIGFNVIQKVEQQVFGKLQREGKARFYWDFDVYYMPSDKPGCVSNEAGHYISQYLKCFPNEFDSSDNDIYSNFTSDKRIRYVSASTEDIQARYVKDWLTENDRYSTGKNTAIVLCNESLLPTVIHCFPENVESVNITTGFPLFQTPVASLVMQLMDMRINGYSFQKGTYRIKNVLQVLLHSYSQYISEECVRLADRLKADRIFRPTAEQLTVDSGTGILFGVDVDVQLTQWLLDVIRVIAVNSADDKNTNPLFQESVFRMYTLCNRLNELIKSGDLAVDAITLQKLIIQLINSTSIPFHGEPAEGIQVMGILETRNLDFDNVLILSCNEGNMPKGINDSSFIPYSIRKAYGLTTIDNKVAIYAYYFYNLIQRASDVTIVYNNSTENGNTGEMSRFMLQLMIESRFDIKRFSLQAGLQVSSSHPKEIIKDEKIIAALKSITHISPTSINRYMRCPIQFYYNNVALIKESEDNDPEEMDNRIFGNIFHLASELLYKNIAGNNGLVTSESVNYAIRHKELLERFVDRAFAETLFTPEKAAERHIEYNGLQLINRAVIIKYLNRLLEIDSVLAPFYLRDVESAVYHKTKVVTSDGERDIYVGGRIDRLDQITDRQSGTEMIRVIDYKTGRCPNRKVNSVEDIFKIPVDTDLHADYYLQAMLYAMIIKNDSRINGRKLAVNPALLFIQNTSKENYDPTIIIGKDKVKDIATYEEEFSCRLDKVLSEIFEPQTAFYPAENKAVCEYCPYRSLCGG